MIVITVYYSCFDYSGLEVKNQNKKKLVRVMDKAGYDNSFGLLEDMVFVRRQGWQILRFCGF